MKICRLKELSILSNPINNKRCITIGCEICTWYEDKAKVAKIKEKVRSMGL